MSSKGVAVTLEYDQEPFIEVPRDALWWTGLETTPGEYPASWGAPPTGERRDYVELPAGFGHGSSTRRAWIVKHLQRECGQEAKDQDPNKLRRTERMSLSPDL